MHVNLYQPFSLLITISLIYIPISFCEENEQYLSCGKLLHCGDLHDVGYPFYGEGRPVHCGHPGFELNCEKNLPYITIQKVTYRVLTVDNTTQYLTIARDDLWNNICPTLLYNTSLDFDVFDYDTNERNITLYYGCSTIPGQPYEPPNRFDCSVNDTTGFGFYLPPDEPVSDYFKVLRCNDSIKVPVNQAAAQNLIDLKATGDKLKTALASGFGLKWSANNKNCDQCAQGGGRCGCDPSSHSFVCYCADGPYAFTCKGSSKLGLILGTVLAGVAAMLIICLVIFIIWRRRRKSNGSSYIHSRITSSDPSSRTDLEASSVYPGVPVFSYAELVEATSNFDSSKELGDGGFGIVYYGKLRDGREVAVKRLYEHNYKRVEQFMNEIKILTGLRHRNLVSLYGCTSRRSRELLLVYEYVHNGTVADHLHGERGKERLLIWPIRMNIAFETASALTYLHASDIIHRDVKTNNILLDHNFCVKVADFGLSRLFPNDVTHVSTAPQGTPGYVDPEYHECYQLTNKSDVYSFGVVLIELISSLPAVDISRHRQEINLANLAINRIQSRAYDELIDPSLGYTSDPEVKRMTISIAELAFQCLQVDKELRPKMDEVLEVLKDIKEAKEDFQVLE